MRLLPVHLGSLCCVSASSASEGKGITLCRIKGRLKDPVAPLQVQIHTLSACCPHVSRSSRRDSPAVEGTPASCRQPQPLPDACLPGRLPAGSLCRTDDAQCFPGWGRPSPLEPGDLTLLFSSPFQPTFPVIKRKRGAEPAFSRDGVGVEG